MCYPSHTITRTNSLVSEWTERKNRLSLSELKIKPTICLLKTSFFRNKITTPNWRRRWRVRARSAWGPTAIRLRKQLGVLSVRIPSPQTEEEEQEELNSFFVRPAITGHAQHSSKCRLIFIEDCKSNDTHSARRSTRSLARLNRMVQLGMTLQIPHHNTAPLATYQRHRWSTAARSCANQGDNNWIH